MCQKFGEWDLLEKIHILGQIQNHSIFTNYCLVFFVLPCLTNLFNESKICKSYILQFHDLM